MPSLENNFNELIERVRAGRELGHASYEPIYYLVFSPKEILDVKRRLPAWTARLRNDGWDVNVFSISQAIKESLEAAPLMKLWLNADRKAPLEWDKTNQALANLIAGPGIRDSLRARRRASSIS